VGFDRPPGIFSLCEKMLGEMAFRIRSLYDKLGPDLDVWAVVLLASRPQKGGTAALLAEIEKCGGMTSSTEILRCLALEGDRRAAEGRYE